MKLMLTIWISLTLSALIINAEREADARQCVKEMIAAGHYDDLTLDRCYLDRNVELPED